MNIYNTFEDNVAKFFDNLSPEVFEKSYCIFCNPSQFRHGLFQKKTMRIEACDCGFIYNQTQPKQSVLDLFYEKSDAMKTWANLKMSESQKKKQDEKFDLALSFLRGKVESVCDIGCGVGYFLSKLPSDILRVGVDSHQESLSYASKHGIETHAMGVAEWLDTCKKEGRKFDAVTLWGVLEHVKEPLKVLKDCYDIINKDGYLISCVPNVDSAVVRRFWKECFTFQPVHLWYFNYDTLLRAYKYAGFKYADSWTIEAEVRPLIKGLNGYGPYAPLPIWLEEKVMKRDVVEKMEKEIILTSRGYKIVAIGKKTWSTLQ